MIDLAKLNDHSRQFATRLFREWPQWVQFARFDPYEDFEKEALLVEVPRPVDGSSHGLFITTSEWEISIGFGDNFHTRFGAGDGPGEKNFHETALTFLRDFVDEKIVIATAYENKEWLGSWQVEVAVDPLEKLQVDPGTRVQIRSWSGNLDQVITG